MQHYDSSMCLHTFGNHLLMTQTLCKNITGGNTIEPKHISDSQNDSMPYALYLYIIPQCSRSLPQTYSVSSHAKKTFPPIPPFLSLTRFHAVSGCPGSLSSPLKCHANFRGPRCMGPLSIPLTSVLTGITGRVVACF